MKNLLNIEERLENIKRQLEQSLNSIKPTVDQPAIIKEVIEQLNYILEEEK